MTVLTKDFMDTIQARGQRDPTFRKALLQEGIECLLAGDVDTGKSVRHDCIKAKAFCSHIRVSMANYGLSSHWQLV